MSRYSYAGDFRNPTEGWQVRENSEGKYIVVVPRYCECGSVCCSHPILEMTPHTRGDVFEDEDTAHEWIESVEESYERDYDDYLEENHDAIVQMERYEQWKREY